MTAREGHIVVIGEGGPQNSMPAEKANKYE